MKIMKTNSYLINFFIGVLFSLLFISLIPITLTQESLEPRTNSTFSLDRFNLNQLLYSISINTACRDAIYLEERTCYARDLDRFDGFEVKQESDRTVVFTEDSSSDFDHNVCCAIWRWYDCTTAALKKSCTMGEYREWAKFPNQENSITYYCEGYEFGSYRCWPFPLWSYIVFGIGILFLISVGMLAVIWYWKSGARDNIGHYRRKGPRPKAYV